MKTNKYWYPYEEFGSYFKLEDGSLLQCAMNDDGTADDEDACDVDWENNIDLSPKEKRRLKAVVKELEEKE